MEVTCPTCKSHTTTKKGIVKGKYQTKQQYFCRKCRKRFINKDLKNKTYPSQVIYTALNLYNLGQSLFSVSRQINKTFKVHTSKSTIHSWVHEFSDLCPIAKQRRNLTSSPDTVVVTRRFEHEHLDYEFMIHTYKLKKLVNECFPGLVAYLIRFEQKGCPDVFFEQGGERCSKPTIEIEVKPSKKVNLACRMAGFAVGAAKDHQERHKIIERFLLINDTATIACEIPVWYWEKNRDTGVTGHIDILQVRNNLVYIVDYKPDADHEKKAPWQLYQYAVALSFRTRIPLKQIRCAWFDEEVYYEYDPSEVTVPPITNSKKKA